jgi:cell wall-associated NlpC family hydrolase
VLESLLGVPYLLGGATRAGADCGGLVLLAYREIGIELPPYNEAFSGLEFPPAGAARACAEIERARAWVRVERSAAQAYDVVELCSMRDRDHFGLVLPDSRWLLTTNERLGAHRARWGRASGWEGRIRGVSRYCGPGADLRAAAPRDAGLGP